MGGGYGLYRKKSVVNALEKLSRLSDKFKFERATKENYKIKPVFAPDRSFPIAANHKFIDGNIVRQIGKRLEKWGVCLEKDFLDSL
jgi:hypothetical protein